MKENRIKLLICLGLLFVTGLNAETVWGAQFPAPCPDGKKITFSYYGDIWLVDTAGGKAERLTVSSGYDGRSYWSPDGKWIAFETARWGSDDICLIDVEAKAPAQRLTYYSSHDILYGWTPDSKYILFASQRHTLRAALYKISIHGSLPEMVTHFSAYHVHFMSDDKFYYVRGGSAWWRRHYRGGADHDIWLKTLPNGISQQITDSPGRDAYPMYSNADNRLYFVSNRGPNLANNLWRMNIDGTAPEQMTWQKDDIHFPAIAANGEIITYECAGDLYVYGIKTQTKRKLEITVTEDYKENNYTLENFSCHATEFALSPDETELAFVVHGDIFVMQLKDGHNEKIVRITDTPFIEKHISWHPTKEILVYSSMQDGDMDICIVTPETEEKMSEDLLFKTTKLLETTQSETKARFSPNGEKIAYFKNKEELYTMNTDGTASQKICPYNDVLWIDWSPDSKWLTFSRTTLAWREDIYVVLADGSKEAINISNHPNDDYKPMWSSDGRRIAFGSRDAMGNLWLKYVFLRKEDEDKTEKELEETAVDSANIEVKIDFEDIERRSHEVTQVLGWYNIVAQSSDGKQFAIYSNNQSSNDIWTVDWLGKDLKRITKNNVGPQQFVVSKDKQQIYYLSRTGNLYNASIATAQSLPLSFNIQIGIDKELEREQVFNEAWWALQDGFYDSDFHGVDWQAMYHKSKDWALHMRTTRDFHYVVSMMIGELNASHLGIYQQSSPGEETGDIGIIYDPDHKGGGIKIKQIIPESPIDNAAIDINPGDLITHINGKEIAPKTNFYSMLNNMKGKEIMLTIWQTGKEKNVRVTPVSSYEILSLINDDWVKANRAYVHEKSNNKLGYLHIASMSSSNLKKFKTDLYKEMDKQGLIIDIRYNGGGNISDELINILRRTAYMYSKERNEEITYTSNFRWDRPTVVLINEFCYSDGEIFPAAFKELNLGALIGVPTFGAVIGTNDIRLLDGSGFRIPGTGWFLLTGENLENMPVEPDIYVANIPEQDGMSQDRQLTRAIEELLKQVD